MVKKHDTVPEQADELRQRAEALARGNADWSLENLEVMPPSEAIRRTFHELRVHQIELEMQNEELRRSQVELEAARARYFDLYDLAPVGYCTLSEPGLILEANLTVATLLGVARSALINQRLARFIHKEDANQFHLLSQRLFTTQPADSTRAPQADPCLCQDFLLRAPPTEGQAGLPGPAQLYELRMVKPDGTVFWAHLSATAVQDGDGVAVSRVVISDITERKRFELQLRQVQKMEAVGQLAGGVAHDFNNILAAIVLHLGLLRDTLGIDPDTTESLRELEMEAARGAGLTRQLMVFSRQQAMQVKPLCLNAVLDNLLKMLRRVLGEHIAVDWQGQPDLPAVEADVGMLEQVVVNLCVNARDAMPGGGRLRLSTDLVTVDENTARANHNARAGKYVRLSVSDTGCGIDAATLRRIFEPFYTTKDIGQGTGLGLSIVYDVVKQHAGWVEVESVVGEGTTFRVLLPAKQLRVEAVVAVGPSILPCGHDELVLVIEDEVSVRTVLSKTLRRYGYRVLLADNGRKGADLWAAHRFEINLVMTDMILPDGMTGTDLIQRFRAERPELPVILSSGHRRSREDLAIADVVTLPKPFDMQTLLTVLRHCLDERRPAPPRR